MNVNIVQLAPMRVASVRILGETPERDAWEKMAKSMNISR
jgi:hypothetical protein